MAMVSASISQIAAAMIVAALMIVTLMAGKTVLIPLAGAVIISFMLQPVVRKLVAWGTPRSASVIGVVAIVLAALVATSMLLSVELLSITTRMSDYRENFAAKVRAVSAIGREDGAIKRAADAITRVGDSIGRELSTAERQAGGETKSDPKPIPVAPVDKESETNPLKMLDAALEPATQLALLVLFTVFLLLQHQDMRDRVVRVFGPDNLSETTSAMSEAGKRLSRMFLAQAVLNTAYGISVGIILWLVGLPGALVWGLLAGLMRFVPFIGSYIAAVPPVVLAAGVDPGWWLALGTAGLFLVSELVMGNVVEPLVLGKRVGLSPFAMIAATSFWTLVWGPVGLLLAAPLTMTIVLLGRYIHGLSFVTVLLGDDPPLEPEQELYHRLLSSDSLSTADQLEETIEETGNAGMADKLVFPALALAAQDARTNRLSEDQRASLRQTFFDALEVNPALGLMPEEGDVTASILVAGARGDVDIVAADFLARVIRVATNQAARPIRRATGMTALTGSADERPSSVVIVSLTGVPKRHLELMATRASRNFPGARIFILAPVPAERIGPEHDRPADRAVTSDAKLFTSASELIGNLRFAQEEPAERTSALLSDAALESPA